MIPATPLPRLLRRLRATPIRRAATVPGDDRSRKHFPATAHLRFLIWHGCSAGARLRQSPAMATADPGWWTRIGMPADGTSRSHLACSPTRCPVACAGHLVATRWARIPAARRATASWGRIQLVASTFLALSAQLAPDAGMAAMPPDCASTPAPVLRAGSQATFASR